MSPLHWRMARRPSTRSRSTRGSRPSAPRTIPRPYSDPRVTLTINDGRAALRSTDKRYDLVVFALPDSLTLVSSTANIRLETFLFTHEAFVSVRDHLAPGGVFVLYNFYREHWLVGQDRRHAARTLDRASVGEVLSGAGGCGRDHGRRARDPVFGRPPSSTGTTAPVGLGLDVDPPGPATDDWPFLYLLTPSIAPIYLVAMLLVLVWACLLTWRASAVSGTSFRRIQPALLPARCGVLAARDPQPRDVQPALRHDLAGERAGVLRNSRWRARGHPGERSTAVAPAGMALCRALRNLALAYVLPPATLLIDPPWLRYGVASAIAFAPVFLANLVFTYSFRDTPAADMSFASNLLGAMVGAVLEYLSLVTGYQALLLLVAVPYLLAFLTARRFRLLADIDLVTSGQPPAV